MHKNSTNIMSTNNNNIQIKCNNINSLKSVLHKTRFTIFLIHTNQTCPMVLNGKVGTAFQYIRLYMVPRQYISTCKNIFASGPYWQFDYFLLEKYTIWKHFNRINCFYGRQWKQISQLYFSFFFYSIGSLWIPHPWKHFINFLCSLYFMANNNFLGLSGCLLLTCWMYTCNKNTYLIVNTILYATTCYDFRSTFLVDKCLIYNYLCNQCLSPLKLWVRTPFMVRCTQYNIMW